MNFKAGDTVVFKDSNKNRHDLKGTGLIGQKVKILKMRIPRTSTMSKYLFDCILCDTGVIIGEYYDYRFERVKPILNKQIQIL